MTDRFESGDRRHELLKQDMDKEDLNLLNRIMANDAEIVQIRRELTANEEDRNELHQKDDFLQQQMATQFEGLDKKFSEKCTKLFDKQVYAEKEIN